MAFWFLDHYCREVWVSHVDRQDGHRRQYHGKVNPFPLQVSYMCIWLAATAVYDATFLILCRGWRQNMRLILQSMSTCTAWWKLKSAPRQPKALAAVLMASSGWQGNNSPKFAYFSMFLEIVFQCFIHQHSTYQYWTVFCICLSTEPWTSWLHCSTIWYNIQIGRCHKLAVTLTAKHWRNGMAGWGLRAFRYYSLSNF